jgi:spore germination cell wall hydrolase CwlJ-like protein
MTHVLLKDDDDSPTETATVAVVAQGNSRWEEQTGNAHDDNSTQGTTLAVVTQGSSRGESYI